MHPVKIAWVKETRLPIATPYLAAMPGWQYTALQQKVQSSHGVCFQISPQVFVEIPPAGWGRGDLLIYLPERGWLVRTNYRDAWYVDMGLFKSVAPGLYAWNDLWLDVTAPQPATRYHLVDSDEFAAAVREGKVSAELAAYALDSLHRLVTEMQAGQFPPPEVLQAQAFAAEYQRQRS